MTTISLTSVNILEHAPVVPAVSFDSWQHHSWYCGREAFETIGNDHDLHKTD